VNVHTYITTATTVIFLGKAALVALADWLARGSTVNLMASARAAHVIDANLKR